MKCFQHNATDSVAVCAYCGKAICLDCIASPTAARMVCSQHCATALTRESKVIQLLLDKSSQSARASAFYCYLTGGLSAAAAVAAWFILPSPFLIYFTGGCAAVLFAAGFWYGRGAKQHGLDS
jgi:hypothetical protein